MTQEPERHDGLSAGPSAFGDDFSATDAMADGRVTVIHGIYAHSAPLVGMSVSEAIDHLQKRMRIDPESTPVVDGVEVDGNTILCDGQVLNLVKRSGEMGGT